VTRALPAPLLRERLLGPNLRHALIALGLLLLLGVILIWPLVEVVAAGFQRSDGSFTTEYLRLVLANPVVMQGLLKATLVAFSTTLVALALALPLAVIVTRYEFRGRALLSSLLLLPMVLPPFVGAIGMRSLLSRFGPLTQLIDAGGGRGIDWLGTLRLFGVVSVEALALYPIIFLNLRAALANVDPLLERAAANLGASRWTVLRRVTLPLVRPGFFAGCTLAFIWSFTELGTPLMFHVYDVTPVQVFTQIVEVDNPLPYALVVVMLAGTSVLYIVGKVLFGRSMRAASSKSASASAVLPLRGVRAGLAALPLVCVALLALSPHVSVLLTSFSATGAWYRSIIPREFTGAHYLSALREDLVMPVTGSGPLQLGAVGNSIVYAGTATALGVALAIGIALIVVRSRVPFRGVLDVLSVLPLAVPGLVMAFGYL
jgi:iron(III) transport system permease protein